MQIKKGTEIRKQLIESFYFKNRMAIAVEIVVAIVTGLLAVTVSWVSQQLMDAAAMAPGAGTLLQLAGIVGVLISFFISIQMMDYHVKPRFVRRAMQQYKDAAFRKMTEKNISSFRKENTATYLSALSNDANSIENGYLCGTLDIIHQIVNFVGAIALMLWYSPLMTLL